MIGDPQRVRSSTTTTPLQRSGSVDSVSSESNPLSGHSASQGTRGASVLSRIKTFFSSLFSMAGKPFAAMARALGDIKAKIGEAIEARRQNALKSPGPPQQERTERPRSRDDHDPPVPQGTQTPPDDRRTRTQPPDGSRVGSHVPPPDDDDDGGPPDDDSGGVRRRRDAIGQDSRPPGRVGGGNGPDSLTPHDDVDDASLGGGNGPDSLAPRGGSDELPKLRAREALRDGDLAGLSTGGDEPRLEGRKLIAFMGKHSVATSSPAFWATTQAKENVATLGGALAFSVLDKVKAAGQMSAQDRADFMQALQLLPRDPSLPPLDQLSDDMLGALDADNFEKLLGQMADMLMSVYGGAESDYPLPGADYLDAAHEDIIKSRGLSGAAKVDALRDVFVAAISDEFLIDGGMEPDTVRQALEAMS